MEVEIDEVKGIQGKDIEKIHPRKSSIFNHYFKESRLVRHSILITPDRYFTIVGMAFAAIGILAIANQLIGVYEDTISLILVFLATIFAFICAPYTSFFLTRLDTKDFTRVLENSTSTYDLTRHIAFESLSIVYDINRQKDKEGIKYAINRHRNSLRTIDSLKEVLADRLMLSPREACDDFLRFSSSIYINRQVTRALALEQPTRGMKKSNNKKIEQIEDYSKNIEKHLFALLVTEIDFKKIEFMFQTKSISAITEYYIWILDKDRERLNRDRDFTLLYNLQQSHRNGVAAYRALGIELVQALGNSLTPEKIAELECRVDACLGRKPKNLNNLEGWFGRTQDFIRNQRNTLVKLFSDEFAGYLNKFNDNKLKTGHLYIVLTDYSRALKSVVEEVIAEPKNYELYGKVRVVILIEDEVQQSFSWRLMFHRVVYENQKGMPPEHLSDAEDIGLRTWRSTPAALKSRIDKDKDQLVILSGCDRIGRPDLSLDDHLNIAFTHQPMSLVGQLINTNEQHPMCQLTQFAKAGEDTPTCRLDQLERTSEPKVDVFVVAGSYKYDLNILMNKFDEKSEVRKIFESKLKKYRRYGLYQWKSEGNITVRVITPEIPNN